MSKKNFTTHHGMTDLLPGEIEHWQALETIVRETAGRYHFREIRTPILEQTELIARGIGQLTDIVSKEMFAFERGDDKYVLRPEGTAPVARAYVQHHLDQQGGAQRLYYIGPFFRAERPQKGRQRQFHQFGAELIGASGAVADVEIIAFMMDIYKQVGITNTRLKLNTVGDPETRGTYRKALYDYYQPLAGRLSEVSRKRLETNPMRILDSKEEEDLELREHAPRITDYLSTQSKQHFDSVKNLLDRMKIPYEQDPYLVRGLDYYTETAFELISPDLGSQDALGGGGRYDLLIEEVGGLPTPAVGFASGIERLMIACEALEITLAETGRLDVYFVTRGDQASRWALETMPGLRAMGLVCTMDFAGKSIKAQMKDANRQQARFAVIVGEQELADNCVTLRDMVNSKETSIPQNELPDHILPGKPFG